MKNIVLGFDTSNYRTSAAAVTTEGEILINSRKLLPVGKGQRGLRQSEALFAHVKQLREVILPLRENASRFRIAATAASSRPRNAEDSYMPVFQAGETMACGIASVLDVPCILTDHQSGHVRAAAWGTVLDGQDDFLALHLSGGTTELLEKRGEKLTRIGGSLDLHAGQLVDRAGVAMGLPFPSGEALEVMARQGKAEGRLGCSMESDNLFCHLSGAETRVQQWIRGGKLGREDIAREIYDLLVRTVSRLMDAGAKKTGLKDILIAGGVASSALFREMLSERRAKNRTEVRICFGQAELSGDNAVGVALIGADRLKKSAGTRENKI